MNCGQALSMARLGYRVFRKTWPQGQVVILAGGKTQLRNKHGELAGVYIPTGDDRAAGDWQQQ